ncbi:MAG: dihydrofolate reductase [Alphaproteobacteria bacterium]|nr:dihydrofolate reductase [Alphaproteobacteria bacterium]NCQ89159.1 dihydrofolate reductase [Alphaproteobacteria bacterium]NCT08263.1 dihydrofolate reductase [Alphaproteobacteria bacterium]
MIVSLIVAAADNNCIGIDNKMPWHIPEDFKHFKEITMGKPCIMGRKTYESILAQLGKPLLGRTSIVISRSAYKHDGAISANSLGAAIDFAKTKRPEEVMIIGGAQIYAQAIEQNLADKLYLTRVHQSPEGDAFFPDLDHKWIETEIEKHKGFDFVTLERKS